MAGHPAQFASEWGTLVPRHGDVVSLTCPRCGSAEAEMELIGVRCYGFHERPGGCGWSDTLTVRGGRIDDPGSNR